MPTYQPQSEHSEDDAKPLRRRCRHILAAGHRCGSPCLRTEQFCYYHHTTRKPVSNPRERKNRASVYDLPNPEDRDSVRAAVTQVMHAIAHNNIDIKRAGMLLYSLQISLCSLPPQPRPSPLTAANSNPARDIVEDTVLDDTHGVIAPEEEYEEPEELKPRKSLGQQLLDEVEAYEAKQAAEAEQDRQAAFIAAANPASATSAPPDSHRPAAIDLRAAAEDSPSKKPGKPSRLRVRLQPCRNRRLRSAASAAEVRFQPLHPSAATKLHISPTASQTAPDPPIPQKQPPSTASSRHTVDILSSYGRRNILRPGKLDRAHVVFPPGRLVPE